MIFIYMYVCIAQPQELYRLAVQLYIYCCVVDLLLHCSATVSMSKRIIYCSINTVAVMLIGELMNLLDQFGDIIGSKDSEVVFFSMN